jgi:hypothetical protein
MKGGCLSVQRGSTARLPSAFTHFITVSDIGIKVLLIPENIENLDYSREISFPDVYPLPVGSSLPYIGGGFK